MAETLFKFYSEDDEPEQPESQDEHCWRVLVIDDEDDIHEITRLVLSSFEFDNKPLKFINAYSGEEAKTYFEQHNDIAVALVDVVMETNNAGLELIKHVRNVQQNTFTRLILRTGQPGEAPEESVIRDFDINDYKNKTELTSIKLKSLMYSALRGYRDLCTIKYQNKSLERLISVTAHFVECDTLHQFAEVLLAQTAHVLTVEPDTVYCCAATNTVYEEADNYEILALSGEEPCPDQQCKTRIPAPIKQALEDAHNSKQSIHHHDYFVGYYTSSNNIEHLLYVSKQSPLERHEHRLLELFANNIAIAYERIRLREISRESQKELSYILGEAVEKRSKETGSHVKRVALFSHLLAIKYGLSEYEAEVIKLASPLHDVGKIGIPDRILNKTSQLDDAEWEIMKTHAQLGYEILRKSKNDIIKVGAIIAHQHHEKWDGTGYPNQLKELEISIEGRISALADVFDALASSRCYKPPWPTEKVIEFLKQNSGKHFEPKLVNILLNNLDAFLAIRDEYPDEDE
ncbi:DUF3369 domain-containing protein [Flocculibacter collagenilyticus]|uniref:DUF3369 domain-containing protein n=1 Tax=Flocculibacter collagenilyticus TaxID=2744479 RepID=UPI0018F7B268|nr:DUF3369 domain-containing protein [Flocculibacter collagenilyticus]